MKEFIHFYQLMAQYKVKHFCQFDYGSAKNIEKYGYPSPPNYNLNLIAIPIHIHYGDQDQFLTIENVEELSSMLPHTTLILAKAYDHEDFLYNSDAAKTVYEGMIEIMNAS